MQQNDRIDHIIDQMDQSFFVGRERELALFQELLLDPNERRAILNIFAAGGCGKSYMLRQFERIAESHGALFAYVDARNIKDSTNVFSTRMMDISTDHINRSAAERKVVIAVDSYEEIQGADRWFREQFVRQLHRNTLLIIAGRRPLDGEWIASPSWRNLITSMPLSDLAPEDVKLYANKLNVMDDERITFLNSFTRGHALTLSLAAAVVQTNVPIRDIRKHAYLSDLVPLWLREVPEAAVRDMLKAASILRTFDQETLAYVMEQPISSESFERLLALSFIRHSGSGWMMHDLIRELIVHDTQSKTPQLHRRWFHNALRYYYGLIRKERGVPSQASKPFFYLAGDLMSQSAFFQPGNFSSHYIEAMDAHNVGEVEQYWALKRTDPQEKHILFNRTDHGQPYEMVVPASHDYSQIVGLSAKELLALNQDIVYLLKNETGELLGVAVIFPINEGTVDYLRQLPVTRAYFRTLSEERIDALRVPAERTPGWYVRMMDVRDGRDNIARSELMSFVFSYVFRRAFIVTSSAVAFHQQLLTSQGYEKVDGASHTDFGPDFPAPTYMLNLTGSLLDDYLRRLLKAAGLDTADDFPASYTDREREVLSLLLQGKTNAEIAAALFLSEITVKKHVSAILSKTGVKNRAQLISRLSDQG